MRIKVAAVILLCTITISTSNMHAFFGMMMNMMQMPMQMMQGMNPMGQGRGGQEGGMFGLMNNMVNGMTDGMKLGFQGIDCFGDKIGLMSNRITQFAGRGAGRQGPGYGTGCDFNRIPLVTGQSNQEDYDEGRYNRAPRRARTGDKYAGDENSDSNSPVSSPRNERKRARTALDNSNDGVKEPQKRERLALDINTRDRFAPRPVILTQPYTGQAVTLDSAPQLRTSNKAKQMYVHLLLPEIISLAGDKVEGDNDKIAHIFLFNANDNWDNVWKQSLL